MDIHKNAQTIPYSRALIARRVRSGERVSAVAQAVGVCDRTVRKWVRRDAEGELVLDDRSCRPHHSPRAIGADIVVEIERLRRRYRWTGADIATAVGVSKAMAARTLRQLGHLLQDVGLQLRDPSRSITRSRGPHAVAAKAASLGRAAWRS